MQGVLCPGLSEPGGSRTDLQRSLWDQDSPPFSLNFTWNLPKVLFSVAMCHTQFIALLSDWQNFVILTWASLFGDCQNVWKGQAKEWELEWILCPSLQRCLCCICTDELSLRCSVTAFLWVGWQTPGGKPCCYLNVNATESLAWSLPSHGSVFI